MSEEAKTIKNWKPDTPIEKQKYKDVEFEDCDFSGVTITGSRFKNCIFINVNFSGSTITKSSLYNSQLLGSNFSDAKLEKCNLSFSNFWGSNFEGVSLIESEFKGTNFSYVNFINLTYKSAWDSKCYCCYGLEYAHINLDSAILTHSKTNREKIYERFKDKKVMFVKT